MLVETILKDDWEEFEAKRKSEGRDPMSISFLEEWESVYVKNKIQKHFPGLEDRSILLAIIKTGHILKPPHKREEFLADVIKRLESLKN